MPWTPIDDLTLDDQVAKMIGPIPPSPFAHRKIEIRKLQVAGYNGYSKKIQEEFNVEFKTEYQIGNGRFGKVYRGTSLDNNTVFAFKGTVTVFTTTLSSCDHIELRPKSYFFKPVRFRNRDHYQRQNRENVMNV